MMRWLWLLAWLTEAVLNTGAGATSICDLGPCSCSRGRLHCDCSTSPVKEVTLSSEVFDSLSLSAVSVTACPRVTVNTQAFAQLAALRSVSVMGAETLTLHEQAFSWQHRDKTLVVNLTDCGIPEIPSYCFRGALRDVLLTRVHVTRVRAFAFVSLEHVDKLEFSSVLVDQLDSQAFKRFGVQFLAFVDTRVPLFHKRTMQDVVVHQEMRFVNLTTDWVETMALVARVRNMKLINCSMGHVERRAFDVLTEGDVSVHDNVFAFVEQKAFAGFSADPRYVREAGKQDFLFENNTLTNFESGALTFNTSGLSPRLDWININKPCSCSSADFWVSDLIRYSDSSVVDAGAVVYCLDTTSISVKNFQRARCSVTKSSLLLKILLGTAVLAMCSAIVVVVYCRLKKKGKKYINVATSPSALKAAEPHKGHVLVVPDGKTYRETELHVIIEHAEPIVRAEYVRERPERPRE